MDRRTSLRLALFLWTVAFIISFLDFNFGGGEQAVDVAVRNFRVFVIWQSLAIIFAIWAWIAGNGFEPKSSQRVSSRVPGILQIAIAIGVVLFVVTAGFIAPTMTGS
ncbi:MAG TPA: hypothetical protein DEO85_13320 [Maritimibacter sp.]|nr:hypothetical protein [Maritimibacter sp.]